MCKRERPSEKRVKEEECNIFDAQVFARYSSNIIIFLLDEGKKQFIRK